MRLVSYTSALPPPQRVSKDYESSSLYSLICDLDQSNSPAIHSDVILMVSEIKIIIRRIFEELNIAGSRRITSMSKIRNIIANMKNWLLNGGLDVITDENPHSNSFRRVLLFIPIGLRERVKVNRITDIRRLVMEKIIRSIFSFSM